jgi:hypothetical protein
MEKRDWIPLTIVLLLLSLYLTWAYIGPSEEGQAALFLLV